MAEGSKGVIDKLLGPSAELIGEELKGMTQWSIDNLKRIFTVASAKTTGEKSEKVLVNSRVLKHVVDEGKFVDDSFSAEYYGGILASAKSEDGKDDDAIPFLATVKNLGSKQLRMHFIVYALLASCKTQSDMRELFEESYLSVPLGELSTAMGLRENDTSSILLGIAGLIDAGLIGSSSKLSGDDKVVFFPAIKGARLFLRALGLKGIDAGLLSCINIMKSVTKQLLEQIQLPLEVDFKQANKTRLMTLVSRMEIIASEVEDLTDEVDELKDKCDALED